jgi:hypothetical protein
MLGACVPRRHYTFRLSGTSKRPPVTVGLTVIGGQNWQAGPRGSWEHGPPAPGKAGAETAALPGWRCSMPPLRT